MNRNSIKGLCNANIFLLVLSAAMMYWSVFWIVGAVILVIGSIIDAICLQKQQNYSLGWHVFMVIVIPLSVAAMIYWTYDIWYVYANLRNPSPSNWPWLFAEAVLTTVLTIFGIIISMVEIKILIIGGRAGIPTCCCSQQPVAPAIIVQVPIDQPINNAPNQGFEVDLEKCEPKL